MIEITKTSAISFIKQEIPWLFNVEKKQTKKKKIEDGANLFFKTLANRFCLTSKNCLQFNRVDHGRPSIKWTSWKGNDM